MSDLQTLLLFGQTLVMALTISGFLVAFGKLLARIEQGAAEQARLATTLDKVEERVRSTEVSIARIVGH